MSAGTRLRGRALIFALALTLTAVPCGADAGPLAERASALELHRDRLWLRLLHHRPGRGSRVASAAFFLSPDGARDPQSELRATLAALAGGGEPAREAACRFPARRAFLARRLDADAQLARPDCPAYDDWRRGLDVRRVTLVFAGSTLGNPASMFGHTLLRLDGPRPGDEGELLSRAVSFAARTDDPQGLVYAYQGLTGGYDGRYGLAPYHRHLRSYARIDNRDLWEYQLALDAPERERLVAHLWELRDAAFPYYFLKENCSYQLLALLDIARPELNLTADFAYWALPVDTVRAVTAVPGLLQGVRYRPALHRRIRHREARLDPPEGSAWQRYRRDADVAALEDLPPAAQARVLELAHDWWYWRAGGEATPQARAALDARSRIDVDTAFPPLPPPAVRPDQGHATQRIAAGLRHGRGQDSTRLLAWRPGYHDLLDPAAGYPGGAQIDVLAIRLSEQDGRARLDRLRLLDIVSLGPALARPQAGSWRLGLGFRRADTAAPGEGYLEGGWGVQFGAAVGLRAWGLALAQARLGRQLEDGYAFDVGAEAGLLAEPLPGWRWQLRARRWQALASQAGEHRTELRAATHWQFRPRWGLRLGARRLSGAPRERTQLELEWLHYF